MAGADGAASPRGAFPPWKTRLGVLHDRRLWMRTDFGTNWILFLCLKGCCSPSCWVEVEVEVEVEVDTSLDESMASNCPNGSISHRYGLVLYWRIYYPGRPFSGAIGLSAVCDWLGTWRFLSGTRRYIRSGTGLASAALTRHLYLLEQSAPT